MACETCPSSSASVGISMTVFVLAMQDTHGRKSCWIQGEGNLFLVEEGWIALCRIDSANWSIASGKLPVTLFVDRSSNISSG